MQTPPINSVVQETQPATITTKFLPVVLSVLIGAVLLFAAGFAETNMLHNAAHDSRHAVVFPCH